MTYKWQPDVNNARDVKRVMEMFAAKHQHYTEEQRLAHNSKLLRKACVTSAEFIEPAQKPKCHQTWVEKCDHNPTEHFIYQRFTPEKKVLNTKPETTSVTKLIRDVLEISKGSGIKIELIDKRIKRKTQLSIRRYNGKDFLHCKTRHVL